MKNGWGFKGKYSAVAFVTALSLVITLAAPGITGQGGDANRKEARPVTPAVLVAVSDAAMVSSKVAGEADEAVSTDERQTAQNGSPQTNADENAPSEKPDSAKPERSRIEREQEIAAKTIAPEPGQKYDGYIVIANDDLKADAETSGYTASTSGDYIKVDEPLDALAFTDPALVDCIIPNIRIQMESYPNDTNDPSWSNQWSLYPYETTAPGITTGHGIGVSALYRRGLTGSGIDVGIFDTGLGRQANSPHPDLRKNFTSENGINFATMAGDPAPSGDPWPTDAYDCQTHGTAVAGFIAAVTNNTIGIAGVASGVEVHPYRVFQSSSGSLFTIFYGLEYLIDNEALPDVINMSLGTDTDEYVSMNLKKLFDEVAEKGTIVAVAASNNGGNLGTSDYLSYPASFDSVIAVANSRQDGSLLNTSQENEKIDVTAPGTSVYSLKPDGTSGMVGSGTSFASPLVAGVAAALKQRDSSIDVYAFRELIKRTSRKIRVGSAAFNYDANGHSDSYGYGLIDAEAMLTFLEQPGLYRIKYDLDGGSFDKSCDPVIFATAGAFANGITLPGISGEKPKKDGYIFAGWTLNGGATTIAALTTAHRPSNTNNPVEVKARWTAGTYLRASDFIISFDDMVEIEDAGYYDGASGYARGLVSLSALAGVQSATGDPVVGADVNSVEYIETMGEGCYYVDFTTSSGAFATVAMTVYKAGGFGGAAGLTPTVYELTPSPSVPAQGASVIAHNFTVSLSAVVGADAARLAGASSYRWQRIDNTIKGLSSGALTVEGFSSIAHGGVYTVHFRSVNVPTAVVSRSVTVIEDIPPLTQSAITYDGNGSAAGSMATQSAVYGATVTLSPVQYTKPDYVFVGWSTSSGKVAPAYSDQHTFTQWAFNGDLTLYAQWRPAICIVSYYDETGALICTGNAINGDLFWAPTWYLDLERSGYVYTGWNTKPDGTGVKYTSQTPVTDHISVYPTWVETPTTTSPGKSLPMPVRSVTLKASAPANHVIIGNSIKLKAVFSGSSFSTAETAVLWKISSADGTNAKVDAKTGVFSSGSKEGIVKVRATSVHFPGVYSDVIVAVAKPVTKLRIPVTKLYMKKGASITVPVAADNGSSVSARLTWTTSNSKIATVNPLGSVKAIAPGNAIIRVNSLNGKTKTFTVYVASKAVKVKKLTVQGIARSKVMKRGKTTQIKVKITPVNATITKIAFSSNKPSVLSVDQAGMLKAKKKGTATIKVTAGNKSQKIKIKVK
ncbi:MAG: S8 family serine peptidase [Clostridiales Family XIII bacterium]|nr:S8 family serine peptidase [Clostridiales Family XIII bacterium]